MAKIVLILTMDKINDIHLILACQKAKKRIKFIIIHYRYEKELNLLREQSPRSKVVHII